MKNIRITLLALAAVVVLSGFCYFGYQLYQKFQRPAESPFNAIPGNTALIIKLNKAGNLWKELNRSNLLWKSLSHFPGVNSIRNEIQFLDSTSRKNEKINEILQQYNVIISITLSGRSSFGALYLSSVTGSNPESYILDFIRHAGAEEARINETPYAATRIHRIQLKGSHDPFYFAVLKGIFMGSFHSNLVKKAIDRLSLNTSLAASSAFRRVESTSGKKVDANIYINYRFFSLVISKIIRDENLPDLLKFSCFADWSGLDVIIKKDELLLNGYTVASDSNLHFLSLFSDQVPQKIEITSVIPADVSYLTFYGLDNPKKFIRRFQAKTIREETYLGSTTPAFSQFEQSPVSIEDYILPWIGNEACLFVIEDTRNPGGKTYAGFKVKDTLQARENLLSLADTLGLRVDSVTSGKQKIYHCPIPGLLPYLFGDLFGKVNARYFTFLNGYLMFSQDSRDLSLLIEAFKTGNTLAKSKEYLDFTNNMSNKSNVFCYFNTSNSLSGLKKMLNQNLAEQLTPMMDSIKKFESLAFQFNNQEGMFYSTLFMRFNPNPEQEGPLQWQAVLDTTVSSRPLIIPKTKGRSPSVLVTDIANNLYLFHSDGILGWKLHLMGKPLGEIHPILLKGSDSLYFLFNTDTHLYLIRSDGQFADRYPMRFPLHATNGLTLVDYNRNGDYRVLVAFMDNRVYKFSLDGLSITGWERPNALEEILKPVEYRNYNKQEYLIVAGKTGQTFIVDRRGKPRMELNPKLQLSPNSGLYLNRSNKRGLFVTTDQQGKAIFIQENGKTSEVTMNLFSPSHWFFYEDITGNGQPEFIYLDKNNIYYYNRSYKLVFSYAFRREISSPPFVIKSPDGKTMIGIVAPETRELYLFDKNGYREMESGIRGTTAFDIGRLGEGYPLSLIVGNGKFIRSYRLSQ